jgi:alpha-D-ribose 1-methylphosphonate 5-triphosphate diphosphatase
LMSSFVIENAAIVTPDQVFTGWAAIVDGVIVEVGQGASPESGHDFEGDYLIAGLIELHTDNLEAHMSPRPSVQWHPLAACLAYDAQIAASGITTVFDSLRVGSDFDSRSMGSQIHTVVEALAAGRQQQLFRCDHKLHLRCEICTSDVIEATTQLIAAQTVHMISLMDHTPGLRQFRSVDRWKKYYGGKSGLSSEELDAMASLRLDVHMQCHDTHRSALVDLARISEIVLASHDDTTLDHVSQSVGDGVRIAEFPTTLEAANASHAAGIHVLMGAPNIVRRGSHSGNVAAEALALHGVLDILSSDYVPSSLLMGAFELARNCEEIDLAAAIRTVTVNPARATGLTDRGAIAVGLKADIIRVKCAGELPIVREVYRDGRRVV